MWKLRYIYSTWISWVPPIVWGFFKTELSSLHSITLQEREDYVGVQKFNLMSHKTLVKSYSFIFTAAMDGVYRMVRYPNIQETTGGQVAVTIHWGSFIFRPGCFSKTDMLSNSEPDLSARSERCSCKCLYTFSTQAESLLKATKALGLASILIQWTSRFRGKGDCLSNHQALALNPNIFEQEY